jgi:S1-C subfamily serine protease
MQFHTLLIMLVLAVFMGWKGLGMAVAATPAPVLKPMKIHACHTQKQYQLPRDLKQVLRSVVIVQNKAEIGSGVIVSEEGYILTAAHVLANADQVAVYLNSGSALPAKVVRMDTLQDIALIKIPDNQYPCLPMMTSPLPAGSHIFSLGFSLEGNNGILMKEGKVKSNRFARANGPYYLQTNLDLKPGHSGGPLLNRYGQVAGIISWKMRFDNSQVFSFGSPVSTIKPSMKISWHY